MCQRDSSRSGADFATPASQDARARELGAVLAIRYRSISESDLIHSNLLSVVEPAASAGAIGELLERDE